MQRPDARPLLTATGARRIFPSTATGTSPGATGSLYPALQQLQKEGLITSDWGTTDNNRRARYYRLTASGRRVLGEELESWRRFAAGLEAVLRTS